MPVLAVFRSVLLFLFLCSVKNSENLHPAEFELSKNTFSYSLHQQRVMQPNSFNDTGTMNVVETQKRGDIISERQLLTSGDILVKRLNPSFVHVVTIESEGMAVSQNLLVVRPGNEVDPYYLGYLLEQKEILGQVEHVTGSTAAIKAISIKKLADIMIPVIPITDQRKVGEVWELSRKRKQLLNDYMAESDRLVSMLASKIIGVGGKVK